MEQFCVSSRQKAIKKACFCLIGSFLSKKFGFYLRAVILKTISYFFPINLETDHFSIQGSVDDNLHLQSNGAQ